MKLPLLLALAATRVAFASPAQEIQPRQPKDDPNVPHIDDPKFISTVLDAHYYWRKIHCAQELKWDPKLAQAALDSVNACTENVHHDRGGSNLSGVRPAPSNYREWTDFARDSIHGWHEEEPKYPYGQNPEYQDGFGHFTQLVWRDSSRIGCALGNCDIDKSRNYPGRVYCFYENAGNNIASGEFEKNVWPPVCADPDK